MSILEKLTVSNVDRGSGGAPIDRFRKRMSNRIDEQMAVARAAIEGVDYTKSSEPRERKNKDGSVTVLKPRKPRPWFWKMPEGAEHVYGVQLRVRGEALPLHKDGKTVKVKTLEDVVTAFETLKEAVGNGELDQFADMSDPRRTRNDQPKVPGQASATPRKRSGKGGAQHASA
jgi:hypothetical protein